MCPPGAVTGGVRITVLIRILVMDTMRSATQKIGPPSNVKCAADCEEIFEQQRRFVGTVSMQPVIPEAGDA